MCSTGPELWELEAQGTAEAQLAEHSRGGEAASRQCRASGGAYARHPNAQEVAHWNGTCAAMEGVGRGHEHAAESVPYSNGGAAAGGSDPGCGVQAGARFLLHRWAESLQVADLQPTALLPLCWPGVALTTTKHHAQGTSSLRAQPLFLTSVVNVDELCAISCRAAFEGDTARALELLAALPPERQREFDAQGNTVCFGLHITAARCLQLKQQGHLLWPVLSSS